jgi:hypothetical protein
MKRAERQQNDEVRPEYDFAHMKGGTRGKYEKRLREQSNIVLLEPEIAEAFPNDAAVNQALRGVLDTARAVRSSGGLREKSLRARNARKRSKRS